MKKKKKRKKVAKDTESKNNRKKMSIFQTKASIILCFLSACLFDCLEKHTQKTHVVSHV